MDEPYDLVIVGGGPSGLAAAINGASELSRVLLIDSGKKEKGIHHPKLGGQARGSSRIDNYPGFPDGISGEELTERCVLQAKNLGAEIRCPERVSSVSLVGEGPMKLVKTREGSEYLAKTVILAPGLSYKKLEAQGVDRLHDNGVLYGAPTTNPLLLGACTVVIVGSANSAGQAAMHLSHNPECRVKILVRGKKALGDQMSKYLVDRIAKRTNIEVISDASVHEAHGDTCLEEVSLLRGDGSICRMMARHLFIFIGAQPKVEWLQGSVAMTQRGFILTDQYLDRHLGTDQGTRLSRETSLSGVFASGDVRDMSTKRAAAAGGDGITAISSVHAYLSRISGNGKH